MKSPNYLKRRNKIYYLRFPNSISDIRVSLKTSNYYKACHLRDKILHSLGGFFMEKDTEFNQDKSDFVKDQAQKILKNEFDGNNGQLDLSHIDIDRFLPKNIHIRDHAFLEDCLRNRIFFLEKARVRNGGRLPGYIIEHLKFLLQEDIIHGELNDYAIKEFESYTFVSKLDGSTYTPRDPVEFMVVYKEALYNISLEYLAKYDSIPVTQANMDNYNKLVSLGIIQDKNDSKCNAEDKSDINVYHKPTLPSVKHTIKQVVEEYIQEKRSSNDITPNTLNDAVKMLNLAKEFLGENTSIEEANNRALLIKYKETLKKLPKNRNKGKYKGKNINALAKMNMPEAGLSVATTNKYLMYLTSLFKYAEQRDYISKSQAYKLQDKNMVHPRNQNDRFDSDELVILFSKLKDLYGNGNKQEKLWIPLISLFTSCRLNEICQMTFNDLLRKDGVWCFKIATEDDDKNKSLKTVYSHRILPLHKTLINLGLVEYLQKQTKKHKPDANMWGLKYEDSRNKYGRTVSRTFNELSKKLLNAPVRRKTFHSIRHTFATFFRRVTDNELVLYFDGHSSNNQTFGRYAKYDDYKWLKVEIDKLKYPFDVEKMLKSWHQ